MPKKSTAKSDEQSQQPAGNEIPTAPPVFDISKPGKTAAEPTSRPIIVSHKPMIKQDPMVASTKEPIDKSSGSAKKTSVEPVSPEMQKPNSDDQDKKEVKKDESNVSDNSGNASDAGAIDALADEAESKKKDKQADEEAAKKAAEIQNLIQSKQYNLPIHDSVYGGKGFFNTFLTVILILLTIGTLFVLAVDAEIIKVNLELPFDLIK